MARLDRAYTSLPGWALTSSSTASRLSAEPHKLHLQGLSDHSPIIFDIMLEKNKNTTNPISKHTTSLKDFKDQHDLLCEYVNLDSLPPIARLQTHKDIIRSAAMKARDRYLNQASDYDSKARYSTMITSARAVAANDLRVAKILCGRSDLAASHLDISGNKTVTLKDPSKFEEDYKNGKIAKNADDLNDTNSILNKNKRRRKRRGELIFGFPRTGASTSKPLRIPPQKFSSLILRA
jgi:hypothetical protein